MSRRRGNNTYLLVRAEKNQYSFLNTCAVCSNSAGIGHPVIPRRRRQPWKVDTNPICRLLHLSQQC
eukprot:5105956-Pyramimonas_sp.AAC.1